MYMFVLDLLILSRAGMAEINNMMQPHGGGRMEEKHRTCVVRMCVAASPCTARKWTVKNKIKFNGIRFVKMWRAWDKWVLIENLLMVQSLKWLDKKMRKIDKSVKCVVPEVGPVGP